MVTFLSISLFIMYTEILRRGYVETCFKMLKNFFFFLCFWDKRNNAYRKVIVVEALDYGYVLIHYIIFF